MAVFYSDYSGAQPKCLSHKEMWPNGIFSVGALCALSSTPRLRRRFPGWRFGYAVGSSYRLGFENSRSGRVTGIWCRELRATASVNCM
jgi:hypothetical protein